MLGLSIPKWYTEGMADMRKCDAQSNRAAFVAYISRKPKNHQPKKKKGGR